MSRNPPSVLKPVPKHLTPARQPVRAAAPTAQVLRTTRAPAACSCRFSFIACLDHGRRRAGFGTGLTSKGERAGVGC